VTIPQSAYTANIVAVILRKSVRKIEDVLREDQIGFRKVKGTGNAVGMLE